MDQIQEVHEMVQQVHGMLRILTNRTITDRPFNGISEGQLPDTDLIILKTTTAIMDSEPAGDEEEEPDHTGTAKVSDSEDSSGSNANGQALLKAIEERNFDSFQSLLQNPETSVKIQDDKERTPLLLAAHLGRERMLKLLLGIDGPHPQIRQTRPKKMLLPPRPLETVESRKLPQYLFTEISTWMPPIALVGHHFTTVQSSSFLTRQTTC